MGHIQAQLYICAILEESMAMTKNRSLFVTFPSTLLSYSVTLPGSVACWKY